MSPHQSEQLNLITYDDELGRQHYLNELYRKIHEHDDHLAGRLQIFRTPGSFLLECALGLLSWDEILQMVTSHPESVCSTECIDERVEHVNRQEYSLPIITSHDGCGAAGVVANLLQSDKVVVERLRLALGEEQVANLLQQLQNGASSDTVGRTWSQALAAAANEKAGKDILTHEHIGVDHDHHYASMTIVDVAGEFMGNTAGQPGERPFVISNPVYMGLDDGTRAMQIMAEWAVLTLQIAWGNHSEIAGQTNLPYQLVVVTPAGFDQQAFNQFYQKAYQRAQEKDPETFSKHHCEVSFITSSQLH